MITRDAIRKPPSTISANTTVRAAAQRMDRDAVGALVVTDDGRPVGIVTDRDLVVRGLARGIADDARVDAVMTIDPVTIDAEADLREALRIFRTHALRRLPVIAAGRVIGLVTVDDLVIDLTADLGDLVRPVTGQVIFGHAEPNVPVPVAVPAG